SNANRSTLMSLALDLTSLGASIKESLLASPHPSPVYLTTVIPYKSSMNPLDTATLEILIKCEWMEPSHCDPPNRLFPFPVLTALNEDSSTVPSLLTDYILKVICP